MTPTAGAPSRVAYCDILDSNSGWTGPRSVNGMPDVGLIDDILEARAGYAEPSYLRVTSASSSGAQVPPAGSVDLTVLRRLVKAGVKLGVAIDPVPPPGTRSVADIVEQAREILAAGQRAGGIYSWIFLDKADLLTPLGQRGNNNLQQVVDNIATAGWSKIMINATGFNPKSFGYLPQRTWAMARHFALLDGDWRSAAARAVSTQRGAVTSADLAFVDYVRQNRPGSTPILKLEVSSQTDRFQQLSTGEQLALLRLWAQDGPRAGYRTIYPLFLPGQDPLGGTTRQYDSVTAGTLWTQRSLMQQYG